jgi:hypothetical protein
MNAAQTKLARIETALQLGATVNLSTTLRVTVVTPKTAAKFTAAGTPLFKVVGDSFYMLERGKYVCADYSAITFTGSDAVIAKVRAAFAQGGAA